MSGIANAASGLPFNVSASNEFNMHNFGRDTPCMIKPVPFGVTKQDGQVYIIRGSNSDRNSISLNNFVAEYPGGPVCRNQGQGPVLANLDAAVIKNILLTERIRMRLRAEAFNVLNHANFAIPTATNSHDIDRLSGGLGALTQTVDTERVMQFSVRIEF